MKTLKFMLPGLILIGGLTVSSTAAYGKKEYTAKEKKPCTTCHSNTKDYKQLNKTGECYKGSKSLAGCAEAK
jgi:protein-arginine kinase activator protein McsA